MGDGSSDGGGRVFEKRRADAPPGFFEAEAAGLAWLAAAGGSRVVGVVSVEPGRIRLERITEVSPSEPSARRFGAALATTHDAGAPAFGAAPPPFGADPPGGSVEPTAGSAGDSAPMFIGRRALPAALGTAWGRFYAEARVRPFLDPAERAGNLSRAARSVVEDACDRIADGEFDDGEPPARIHGDLWAGNVLFAAEGVVLIDPAAHGGHRETDLAMLALFGCPFLGSIVSAYEESHPLAPGWRERVPLHQLHPLAVHAAGHGPSYGHELERAALLTLAL
ncbi:fructosamine kinase family protein [Subtercola boreus]|nr:fructosamine kinase family protein [Subtercola boreus]